MNLKRKRLIKVIEDFRKKYKKISNETDKIKLYENIIEKIENILLEHTYKQDIRFVTYGRRDFLLQELSKRLNREVYTKDYLREAFDDISDYIYNDTWIPINSIPKNLNCNEILKLDEQYKKDGIICEKEKDILLNMIYIFREKIENAKENDYE